MIKRIVTAGITLALTTASVQAKTDNPMIDQAISLDMFDHLNFTSFLPSGIMPSGLSGTGNAEAFVERLYDAVLNRDADQSDLNTWVHSLKAGTVSAADVVETFMSSPDFTSRDLSDSEFIEVLQQAFSNRGPDAGDGVGEQAQWLNQLTQGASRQDVLDTFLNSKEFTNSISQFSKISGLTVPTEGMSDRVNNLVSDLELNMLDVVDVVEVLVADLEDMGVTVGSFTTSDISALLLAQDCSLEELNGEWNAYMTVDIDAIACSLIFEDGAVSMHGLGCQSTLDGQQAGSVTGTVNIDSFCEVTFDATIATNFGPLHTQSLRATLNSTRDNISGISETEGYEGGSTFNLVKFN